MNTEIENELLRRVTQFEYGLGLIRDGMDKFLNEYRDNYELAPKYEAALHMTDAIINYFNKTIKKDNTGDELK